MEKSNDVRSRLEPVEAPKTFKIVPGNLYQNPDNPDHWSNEPFTKVEPVEAVSTTPEDMGVLCACGHTMKWHSLTSGQFTPAATGCLIGCPCASFRPKVSTPLPQQGAWPETEPEFFCRDKAAGVKCCCTVQCMGCFRMPYLSEPIPSALPQQEEPAGKPFMSMDELKEKVWQAWLRNDRNMRLDIDRLRPAPIAPLLGQEEPARKNIHGEVLPEKYRFTPEDEARLGSQDFYSHHEGPRNTPTDVIEADRFMAWRWYGQFMSPMNEAALTGHAWRISRERQLIQALTSLAAAKSEIERLKNG